MHRAFYEAYTVEMFCFLISGNLDIFIVINLVDIDL